MDDHALIARSRYHIKKTCGSEGILGTSGCCIIGNLNTETSPAAYETVPTYTMTWLTENLHQRLPGTFNINT